MVALKAAGLRQRRHSLVTPIDWKPVVFPDHNPQLFILRRHSLVTPIDWKPAPRHLRSGARNRMGSPFFGDAY